MLPFVTRLATCLVLIMLIMQLFAMYQRLSMFHYRRKFLESFAFAAVSDEELIHLMNKVYCSV